MTTEIKDLTIPTGAEEDDLFYFESDHLALKGNVEYSELLKTLVVLESQRKQAIKDYDVVVQLHKAALEDPIAFVQRIKDGEKVGPDLQRIIDVPTVSWGRYKKQVNPKYIRHLDQEVSHDDDLLRADKLKRNDGTTYKKPWTTVEQKRLEELLFEFPPEAIEMRRFKKIAAALGNRNVAQVTSRVQKYFLKLARMGLPIPGRLPKSCHDKSSKKTHPHQRFNHFLMRPSTFFPELDIPVKMDDSDVAPGPSNDSCADNSDKTESNTKNYLLSSSSYLEQPKSQTGDVTKVNEVEVRLQMLKFIKEIKIREESVDVNNHFRHVDYSCDYCVENPILGTRWHCLTCDNDECIDFCTDCMISQMFSSEPHPISHEFITIGAPSLKPEETDDPIAEGLPLTSDSDSDSDSNQQTNDTDSESDSSCQESQINTNITIPSFETVVVKQEYLE